MPGSVRTAGATDFRHAVRRHANRRSPVDRLRPGVCTIHPSPGGFPRGRPALNSSPHSPT
ncbi:hypothetical protein EG812_01770 [Verrucosispora sp. FIM060022]|nr:hypothetical protein EG812_01770 [Verrucosispora sp. FIM060022]